VFVEPRPLSSSLTWLAVAFAGGVCALLATVGADARWLAALGRAIVAHGSIPAGVPYAAASSADWVNVPVLGELVFHSLQALGGDKALAVAQVAATASALSLLALGMKRIQSSDAVRAVTLMLVFFAGLPSFIVARAQLFSLVLFCALLLLLRVETLAPSRRIWLLVPLLALWANLHGAVLVGFAAAGAYLMLERLPREPLVAVGVLASSAAALFLTPAFVSTGDYYLGVLRSEAAQRGEGMWAPLSLHAPFDVAFIVFGIPLLALALRSAPRRWELVCTVALLVLTIHASRNSIWLVCLLAAPAAAGFGRRFLSTFRVSTRPFAICASLPALFLLLGLVQPPHETGAGARVRAEAARLAAGRPILADGLDAEQLALDGHRVWIGNPLDAFSRRDQRLYLDWLAANPAGDALLGTDAPVVLVSRGSPAQRRLAHDPAYRRAARDAKAVVYVRSPSNE
jgi:hypothetical protein